MPLPDAVRELERETDELMEQVMRQVEDTGDEPTPDEDETRGAEEEMEDSSADDEPSPEENPDYEDDDSEAVDDELDSGDDDVEPDVYDDLEAELQRSEQRYKSLAGKYNSDMARLQQQISFLEGKMEAIAQSPGSDTQRPDNSASPTPKSEYQYLSEQEREDFGDEVLDVQSRLARGVTESVVDKHVRELTERLARLEQSAVATNDDKFWKRVDAQIEGASDINENDPLWHQFLDTVEPLSGKSYRELGSVALSLGDVSRMVSLFDAYAETLEAEDEMPVDEEDAPAPRPHPKPGRAKASASPTAGSKKPRPVKESDIEKFYDDVRKGTYRGREKEMNRREAEIEDAVQNGTVLPG